MYMNRQAAIEIEQKINDNKKQGKWCDNVITT